ncbi:hypothetical protein MKW94_003591 [Papaver nudicaule]|uniref:Neprosin PEP catalytic domain-containing protein n=1 Tax=Papaver nudicaule TaxID=74823 RepID=A0AA41RX97_PAPNU|nr:hypothetical protein [Papaver nudicaule]
MGSGHFPSEHGYGQRDAYFASMQYYNASGFLLDPKENLMSKVLGCKRNYNIEYYGSYEEEQEGHSLQYGGPGGNC